MAPRQDASSRAWQASYSARVMTGAAPTAGTCEKSRAAAASPDTPARKREGLPKSVCNEASALGDPNRAYGNGCPKCSSVLKANDWGGTLADPVGRATALGARTPAPAGPPAPWSDGGAQ